MRNHYARNTFKGYHQIVEMAPSVLCSGFDCAKYSKLWEIPQDVTAALNTIDHFSREALSVPVAAMHQA